MGIITGMAPISRATGIIMDTARMYQGTAITMVKADMLLDTAIITDKAAIPRGMGTTTDMERFIDRESGIMGWCSWFFFCLGL